jgi:hypothetical protein
VNTSREETFYDEEEVDEDVLEDRRPEDELEAVEDPRGPGEAVNKTAADEQKNVTNKMSSTELLKSLSTSVDDDRGKTQQEDDIYIEESVRALPFVISPNKTLAAVAEEPAVPSRVKERKDKKKKGRKKKGRKRKKKKLRNVKGGKARSMLFKRYQEKRRLRLRQRHRRKGKHHVAAAGAGTVVAGRRRVMQQARQGSRRRLGGGKLRQLWTQSQKYQEWRRQQSQEQLLAQPAAQLAIEQLWQGLFRQGPQWKQIYQVPLTLYTSVGTLQCRYVFLC